MPKAKKQVLFEVGSPSLRKTNKRGRRSQDGSASSLGTANLTGYSAPDGRKPGFPRQQMVSLTYAEVNSMAAGTVTAAKWQFRLNGCFDPDLTYTGHQPHGFDQWAAMYNHYCVLRTRVVLEPSVGHVTGVPPTSYGMYVSDDATVPSDNGTLIELGSAYAIGTTYSTNPPLEINVDTARFFNRRNVASDPNLRAAVGADPVDQIMLTVWAQDCARSVSTQFSFCLRITYEVQFMEPIDVGASALALRREVNLSGEVERRAIVASVSPPPSTSPGAPAWVRL